MRVRGEPEEGGGAAPGSVLLFCLFAGSALGGFSALGRSLIFLCSRLFPTVSPAPPILPVCVSVQPKEKKTTKQTR